MGENLKRLSQQIIRVSYACHWLWLKMGWRVLGYPELSLTRYVCVLLAVVRICANVARFSLRAVPTLLRVSRGANDDVERFF